MRQIPPAESNGHYSQRESHAGTPPAVTSSMRSGDSTINVMRLHVPLPVMATIVTFTLGLVAAVSATWFHATAHAAAREIHLDSIKVVEGGGVAYKMDVLSTREQFEKKTRRMLKAMLITCATDAAGHGMRCSVDLPEE